MNSPKIFFTFVLMVFIFVFRKDQFIPAEEKEEVDYCID